MNKANFKYLLDKLPEGSDEVFLYETYCRGFLCHAGQFRKSGEPYITHPLQVAITLAELGMDDQTIAAGLLHDVVEDTFCTGELLEDEFGKEVRFLVEGVTKLDKLSCVSQEERQLESYRKMFVAMAEDVRVIIVKLADRLHNMRTMGFQAPEKQKKIAQETLEIFAPIADRLGIIKLKWELEDLCLEYLEPEFYRDLVRKIATKREAREAYIDEVIDVIKKELDKDTMTYEIGGRSKHYYSIYRKMTQKHKELDEIYDLIAIRILVDDIGDCYKTLGLVHGLWRPIPKRIKDYIAMPKANMYQSLHTTVIGPRGERFEIQIRTHEMHQIAEYGVAAHWMYKKSGGSEAPKDVKELSWLNQLKELQHESDSSQDFIESIKGEIFTGTVFVFTPMGEVYELPEGSTPIDFAYRVHTEVGHQCIGAKINGRIVPFDYELKTGDTVEVLRSKSSKGPGRNWLTIAKTTQAKNKIRQWLKKNKREENLERGHEIYERFVKQHNLDESFYMKHEHLQKVASKLGYHSWEDIYVGLGIGGITTMQIYNRLRDEYKESLQETQEIEILPRQTKLQKSQQTKRSYGGVTIHGADDVSVRFASCCRPVPGDPVVGYVTRGHGITVHHADCPNLHGLIAKDSNRVIDVQWEGYENSLFQVRLFVEAFDRPKITPEVMALINDSKVHIMEITSRVKDHMSLMDITVEVKDILALNVIMDKIRSIPDVVNVHRDLAKSGTK